MSRTKIAYFDPLGVYLDISGQLASKLPLVNLHWNPPSRPLRSIPTLDVDLIEETVVSESTPKHQMLGLSAAPYLKIIFVRCEDSDTYRNSVRKMIREWLNNSVNGTRDPTEWLIVHYVPAGSNAGNNNRFKSSVYDKIKADFNSGSKKDRCIQIRAAYISELESMEVWSEAINRIKEGVLEAFSKRVDLYEDEVKKLEAKKGVMGWNFGTFFYMKEGLALSFENISLYEDALILYDQLEAAFASMSRQKNVTFFSSVGFDYEHAPLKIIEPQSASEKRHQIMSNEISLFDFHAYLFGRQAYLLLCISKASSSPSISANKIGELYMRLRTFITETIGLLESNKKNTIMMAEWSYNVVREFLNATKDIQEGLDSLVSEGRGEMNIILRKALETVAASKGWYIQGALKEVSLHESSDRVVGYTLGNQEMINALASKDSFYSAYRTLTEAAIAEFDLSDRVRTVNRLSSQLAMLEFQLGNYERACEQLEALPTLYSRQGWDLISTSLLSVYVQCLVKLNRKENIVSHSLELLSQHRFLPNAEVCTLVQLVQDLSGSFENRTPVHNIVEVSVATNCELSSSIGRFEVVAKIKNLLCCDLRFDKGELCLVNVKNSQEQISFTTKDLVLKANTEIPVSFYSNTFIEGKFRVHSMNLQEKKISLIRLWDSNVEEPLIIELYQNANSLFTEMSVPKDLRLPERRFAIELHTPADEVIESCQITLKPLTTGVRVLTARCPTTIDGKKSDASEVGPLTLQVHSFKSSALVEVPFLAGFEVKRIHIRASIDYKTKDGEFRHVFSEEIEVTLPVDVNVHDFFRADKLVSKFTVSSKNSLEPVRVCGVALRGSDHYETKSSYTCDEPVVVFAGGPASYVFFVRRLPGNATQEDLELNIQHRYIRDECFEEIWVRVEETLKLKSLFKYAIVMKKIMKELVPDSMSWALEGTFKFTNVQVEQACASTHLAFLAQQDRVELRDLIRDTLKESFCDTSNNVNTPAYELKIPVAVPQVDVIHTIGLSLPAADHYVIGDVISVKLEIISVRTWAPQIDQARAQKFVYDIICSQDIWALTGKRRSKFDVGTDERSFYRAEFSIIALKTGKLQLPNIDILADADLGIKMETNHLYNGQTALVVPEFDRLSISW